VRRIAFETAAYCGSAAAQRPSFLTAVCGWKRVSACGPVTELRPHFYNRSMVKLSPQSIPEVCGIASCSGYLHPIGRHRDGHALRCEAEGKVHIQRCG
jgi:hypothetical protein